MAKQDKIAAVDVAELSRWLDDAGSIAELMAQLPFLKTQTEAQRYLDDVREGLESIRAGRFVSHEQVVGDVEQRRRAYRVSAAE